MDKFPLNLEQRETATGFEWFLTVDDEPVQMNRHRTGLFTGREVRPPEALRRVLAAVARAALPEDLL